MTDVEPAERVRTHTKAAKLVATEFIEQDRKLEESRILVAPASVMLQELYLDHCVAMALHMCHQGVLIGNFVCS